MIAVQSGWRAWALAAIALAAALALRFALDPWLGDRYPFSTLFGAIAFASFFCGFGPALVATVAGYLVANWLFMLPRHVLGVADETQWVGTGTYAFSATCLLALGGAARNFYARLRAQVVQTLREKQLVAVTLSGIGDAVITCDREARITLLNPVAEALTGWTDAEARGRPIGEVFRIFNEETRAPTDNPVFRAIREGRITGLANHTVLVTRDGRDVPIDDSAAPIVHEGSIAGAVLVFRDISERKRAYDALAEAGRKKSEFLAILGHELRSPLSAVLNAARVIETAPDNARNVRTANGVILRQAGQLVRLADDLLDVSRVERGTIRLQFREVALADVVEQAGEAAGGALRAGGHRLVVELPDSPVQVPCDAQRIAQVLANLLVNAARYSPEPGEIRLACRADDDAVEVSVIDRGRGIRREDLDKLFGLFARLQPEDGSGGLGIGLALAHSLVALHGGTLTAQSDGPGKGACFTVRLPLRAANAACRSAGRGRAEPRAALPPAAD